MKTPNDPNQLPLIPDEDDTYLDEEFQEIISDEVLEEFLDECMRQFWEARADGRWPWADDPSIY